MVDVKLHDIGEGMHEAEILQFLVKKGDTVENDAPLVEIQTDKMTAELTAPSAGTITAIEVQVGDVVEVGDTILKIGGANETDPNSSTDEPDAIAPSLEPQSDQKQPVPGTVSDETDVHVPQPSKPAARRRVLAAPYTRKIARDHQIDIEQVSGTGPAGRVTDEDVYAFIKNGDTSDTPEVEHQEAAGTHAAETNTPGTSAVQAPPSQKIQNERAFLSAPSGTTSVEIDVTALADLSNQLDVSRTSFFVKTMQVALKDYPSLNAHVDETAQKVSFLADYHVDVFSNGKNWILENVGHQTLRAIDDNLTDNPNSSSHKTFSIHFAENNQPAPSLSNGQAASAVLFPATEKPAVQNGEIVIRDTASIALFYDTRAASAFEATAFLSRVKQLAENPNLLLMELV
ncbi:biotin/lipoyl-containing protein [Bacillus piscicola]|uniref:biotin/lipoyl-containing protein n=1 Tax=Bacillus piscicola TaxID=1632684 RepID=UPI001F09E441|nr:biotin/lipoyl-containing protein [Bacillus piscicola]